MTGHTPEVGHSARRASRQVIPIRIRTRSHSVIRPSRLALLGVVGLVASSLAMGSSPTRVAAAEQGFELLGKIPTPDPLLAGAPKLLTIDAERRLMYVYYYTGVGDEHFLATYDLRPPIPVKVGTRHLASGKLSAFSPMTVAAALDRRTLYFVGGGVTGMEGMISAIGLDEGGKERTTWNMADRLPGFYPAGITYSAEDDRLYAVGEMDTNFLVMHGTYGFGTKPTGIVPTLAAFDPDDGALLWFRMFPDCGQILYTLSEGAFVARSSPQLATPTVFFPCAVGSSPAAGNYPGQAGLVEVRIDPAGAVPDAVDFDVHFHPISGRWFNGAAAGVGAYDYGSDRVFLQSLSQQTPGAWVFDARVGGWVGKITAPSNLNRWFGINQKSGRYYMGGQAGGSDPRNNFLLATDARATPPHGGVVLGPDYAPAQFMLADPPSDRVFVPTLTDEFIVLRDLNRPVPPQAPPDYDAQTDDREEVPGTFVAFTGDVNGFGSRVTAVGDTDSVRGMLSDQNASHVPAANRSIVLARVPAAGVQSTGATAAAQSAEYDTVTEKNLESAPVAPERRAGHASCLDGGGGVESRPAESFGGRAEVRCVLAYHEAAASARQTGTVMGPVTIGDSTFDTTVKRTVQKGLVTTAKATSTGLHIDVPGVGRARIGKVEAVSTTTAHGRSGTASATWTRTVEDVVVEEEDGDDLYVTKGCSTTVTHNGTKATPSGDAGTCDHLAETIRKLLQTRVQLVFPTPAVVATLKGAFARVGQTEADAAEEVTVNEQGKILEGDTVTRRAVPALQLNVYNDSTQTSRYLVQLAGVESGSIYTVNSSGEEPPCHTGACIPGGVDEPFSTDDGTDADTASSAMSAGLAAGVTDGSAPADLASVPVTGRGANRSIRGDGLDSLVVSRRNLGDGALMASFLILVGTAVALVGRRRRLVGLVG